MNMFEDDEDLYDISASMEYAAYHSIWHCIMKGETVVFRKTRRWNIFRKTILQSLMRPCSTALLKMVPCIRMGILSLPSMTEQKNKNLYQRSYNCGTIIEQS